MKHLLSTLVVCSLALGAVAQAPRFAPKGDSPLLHRLSYGKNAHGKVDANVKYLNDSVLVAYYDHASGHARMAAATRLGLQVDRSLKSDYITRLLLPAGVRARGMTVEKAISELRKDPSVRLVEPEYIGTTLWMPNDPRFGDMWGMHNTGQSGGTSDADIDAPEAWDIHRGSANVRVAVIDTGVDYNHPDLAPNILRDGLGRVVGFDTINGDPDPMDGNAHGTHCAGTVGALGDNGIGVIGVSPTVRIIPVKWIDDNGYGSNGAAIAAIDFARTAGAHIMSNSWRIFGESQMLKEAVQRTTAAGILFVAAAGNSNENILETPMYPAAYSKDLPNVLAVGATNRTDNKAGFSSYNRFLVGVMAPGEDIDSTIPKAFGSYASFSGTSMATPHVAGAAALLKAHRPALTSHQLKGLIQTSADRVNALNGYSMTGRLNINAALQTAVDTVAPAPIRWFAPLTRSSSGIRLRMRESGDDGNTGAANYYELRISTRPITPGNYGALPVYRYVPASGPSGTIVPVQLSNLLPGVTYYLGGRAFDDFGNGSVPTSIGPLLVPNPSWYDGGETLSMTPSGGSGWAVHTSGAYSGSRGYMSNTGPSYSNNAVWTLSSGPISVPTGGRLSFATMGDLEQGYDFLRVEASTDNFGTVTTLGTYTGWWGWTGIVLPLSSFGGQTIRIRFVLTSDDSVTFRGVSVDDIAVVAPNVMSRFSDNVEAGNQFNSAFWGLTEARSSSPTTSWTDSPDGNYPNSYEAILTSNSSVNLHGLGAAVLNFNLYTSLEAGWDFFSVEARTPTGTWTEVYSESSNNDAWGPRSADLNAFIGGFVELRFVVRTDSSVTDDGVYLDDIQVLGEEQESYPRRTDILLESGARVLSVVPTGNARPGTPETITTIPAGWEYRGAGDFNGDGNQDIVIRRTSDNAWGCWTMERNVVTGWLSLPSSPGWLPAAFADMNGDAMTDIIMFNPTTRAYGIRTMNGNAILGWAAGTTLSPGWAFLGTYDLDSDGDQDLMLYNSTTRQVGGWQMHLTTRVAWRPLTTLAAGWTPRGFGNANNTMHGDLFVERDSDGLVGAYILNGTTIVGWKQILPTTTDNVRGIAGF